MLQDAHRPPTFQKRTVARADGRRCTLYAFQRPLPDVPPAPPGPAAPDAALELRWNPLLEEWTIHAAHRQDRTFLPADDACPLCPSRPGAPPTEIPAADFELAVFENRFPSLRPDAPAPARPDGDSFRARPAAGACEVVVYTPDHGASLADLPEAHVRRLIEVWADRYADLAARPEVACVFIFENRGREIGVTLTHPHGQIYAYPFVPPHLTRELAAAARHRDETGRCLHCDLAAAELAARGRLVAADDAFVAYVPFAARLPYEVHVVARAHRPSLADLVPAERDALAALLGTVARKYDALWNRPMPYVMSLHQQPAAADHPGAHFHVEFAPPYRAPDRLKYLAGSETGAGAFINDTFPERTAEELRCAEPRTHV